MFLPSLYKEARDIKFLTTVSPISMHKAVMPVRKASHFFLSLLCLVMVSSIAMAEFTTVINVMLILLLNAALKIMLMQAISWVD